MSYTSGQLLELTVALRNAATALANLKAGGAEIEVRPGGDNLRRALRIVTERISPGSVSGAEALLGGVVPSPVNLLIERALVTWWCLTTAAPTAEYLAALAGELILLDR